MKDDPGNKDGKYAKGGYAGPAELKKVLNKKLRIYQDKGHPFASFYFDSLTYSNNSGLIRGNLRPGPVILNGELLVHGDSSFHHGMLRRWLRFRKDEAFSLSRTERIPGLLKSSSLAESWKEPEIEWFGNQAILHLYLKKSSPGNFSGILGLLPGQGSDKKMLLTGNLDASFVNLFRQGISLQFRWARFAPSSQQAVLQATFPSINYAGLGLSGGFELFRQDSLYFNRKVAAELSVPLRGLWKFRLGAQAIQASQAESNGRPALNQGVQSMILGAEMETVPAGRIRPDRSFLSFRLLPGLKFRNEAGINSRYSQLELRARVQSALYHNGRRFWLRGNADAGLLRSEGLMLSDQFRLGGLRSIRGFNENQFFSTAHCLLGLQPGWLLESGFMASVFLEGMLYQSSLEAWNWNGYRQLLGFGFSAEFEAGKNLIQLSIANGWAIGESIDLQSSKIHFGYLAFF